MTFVNGYRSIPCSNEPAVEDSGHVKVDSSIDGLPADRYDGVDVKMSPSEDSTMPIAIVGMSCRFPGDATSPERLWKMLRDARSGWSKVPAERFNQASFYHPDKEVNGAFNAQGGHFLQEDVSAFDAPFFNIGPEEAKCMDPQQRLQLELGYEALENSGIPMENVVGSDTAVFVGVFNKDYERMLLRDPEDVPAYEATGNGAAILSNRLSYFFDLRGPSMTLDTGCSGSLVALHQACHSIRLGESRQAIVGGTNIILDPAPMVPMSMLHFFSDEGRCYTFDKRGSGYGRGEGVACVVIKPLEDALLAGDPIRAVIRNTVVNQDGRTPGITMPNQAAQENMLHTAYAKAGLDPMETGYIEAHGTGTATGDPIEAAAIAAVFGKWRSQSNPIYVGSIKTNVGHLESTSGLAGIVKAVLTLERGMIPPNTNFEEANEKVMFGEWNIKVPQEMQPWPKDTLRRVSVNSFGYGGTNAHAILDGAHHYLAARGISDDREKPGSASLMTNGLNGTTDVTSGLPNEQHSAETLHDGRRKQVFVLTSKSKATSIQLGRNLQEYLGERQQCDQDALLDDLAHTLFARRSAFPWRISVTAATTSELICGLENPDLEPRRAFLNPRVGFVFTGQGAQWHAMGRELMHIYPVFKNALEKAANHLKSMDVPWSLLDELSHSHEQSNVNTAAIGQPLCTAIQLALVDLLASWKVRPTVVTGHSSGEIAAAYACGALSFESALVAAYYRGSLASSIPARAPKLRGTMMAIGLSEEQTLNYITKIPVDRGKVIVACVNSPHSVTVSGDRTAILTLQSALEARQVFVRQLHVDTAYHSHHMKTIASEYLMALKSIHPSNADPSISFISSVTGQKHEGKDLTPSYWVKNMTSQVRFSQALQSLCLSNTSDDSQRGASQPRSAVDILIEIGPHSALAGPIKQILVAMPLKNAAVRYLPSLIRDMDAVDTMSNLAKELSVAGFPLDLNAVNFPNDSYRPRVLVDLPPYAWDHSIRYWKESRLSVDYRKRPYPRHHLLGSSVTDFNPLEPRWRNILRVSESPWLKGHVIQSNMVYPAAGYLAMTLEACRQRSHAKGLDDKIYGYRFLNVSIGRALIVPDTAEGVEIMFSLRPYNRSARESSDMWNEFRVFSYAEKEGWSEHCRGLVAMQYKRDHVEVEGTREAQYKAALWRDKFEAATVKCRKAVDPQQMYDTLKDFGLEYRDSFASVICLHADAYQSIGIVRIPDTAAFMPSGYELPQVIHPGTLDSCLQVIFPSILKAGTLREPVVPTFIEEMFVSSDVSRRSGDTLRVHASTARSGARGCKADLTVVNTGAAETSVPVIEIFGLTCTSVGGGIDLEQGAWKGKEMSYKMDWVPDIELLRAEQVRDICAASLAPASPVEQLLALQAGTFHFIREALRTLTDQDQLAMKPHHRKFYQWMKHVAVEDIDKDLSQSRQQQIIQHPEAFGSEGQMLCRIGKSLVPIMTGEVEPLSLMMEDDLLSELYKADTFTRCYVQMSEFLHKLAHKKPNMTILEIGAGTGGATLPMLRALTGSEERPGTPRFMHFDFTDISSGFFEKAEETLVPWQGLISFRKLDIENEPQSQGFVDGTYDLIVAANVLHATSKIDPTLKNVRKLLKPNGKLVLMEMTRPNARHMLVFGTLPGWWLGADDGRTEGPTLTEDQWNLVLIRNGFSGADVCMPDYPYANGWTHSVIVSTGTNESHKSSFPEIEIICAGDTSSAMESFAGSLSSSLMKMPNGVAVRRSSLNNANVGNKICVCLIEAQGPMMESCTAAQFESMKTMLSEAKGVLWVTRGGAMDSTVPEAGLITGLARAARSEDHGLRLVTLDLDPLCHLSEDEIPIILNVFHTSFDPARSAQHGDLEYAARNGILHIPRICEDVALNDYLRLSTTVPEPIIQPFFQAGRPLRLEVGTPGLMDSLRFIDDENAMLPLQPEELRVEMRASGVNFRDVMISLGQLEDCTMRGECSGIVTEVGANMTGKFEVGDRVCAWGGVAYASSARINGLGAHRFPENMTFETAASIPIVYVTAYYSLVHLAHLQMGETILIHSAAGGVGQAAIVLAQHIGANIFVTVGNEEKKMFLINNFGISEEQIFSSRQTHFVEGIKRLTANRGVDVILNSLAGEGLRESCTCIAPLGRFIEIGKRDILTNGRLEMSMFKQNVTYASVDLTVVCGQNPAFGGTMLAHVFDLIHQGAIFPVKPITVMPISEMETAFRQIQAGKHMGKIVLKAQRESRVKVLPQAVAPPRFRMDSSYLIAGGLGGLGQAMCRWMAQLNAKNIIILSRSGLKDGKSHNLMEELREAGVRLIVYTCDISNYANLKQVLKLCAEEMPPIRGVIQAAMVLKDSTIDNMIVGDYQEAIRSKMHGTRNLHELLTDKTLDFFLMLSSCAGIIGNPGQSNYASGCTYQDALARYRVSQGLQARSIDLGMVESVGYVSEHLDSVRILAKQGYIPIKLEEFLAVIKYAITTPTADVTSAQTVVGLSKFVPDAEIPFLLDAKFSHLHAKMNNRGKAAGATESSSLQDALGGATSFQEACQIICDAIVTKISKLSAIAVEDIDPTRAMSAYGADSLIAVELRNWFLRQLEANVQVLNILSAKPINEMSAEVAAMSTLVDPKLKERVEVE